MKKRLITAVLATATLLSGCGPQPQQPVVDSVSADTITEAPTPSPTPTPIPLPANHVEMQDGWREIKADEEGYVKPDWLQGHKGIIEIDSGVGGIIISSMTSKTPAEVADDIISRYEDSVAANIYATAGDCTIEMAAFGGAVGMFSAPKWGEETCCIFVVGDISSGIGWDLLQKATDNCQQFAVYDYNLSKLLNQRICVDGSIRAMDNGYWDRIKKTAFETSGWDEAENPDYSTSAQQLYKLISAQTTSVSAVTYSGQSETVYTNEDGIRVMDVHLPEGFTSLEQYFFSETKERGVYVSNDTTRLILEGTVPAIYKDYLDELFLNEEEPVIWTEPEEVADTEGEEGETEEVEEEAEPTEETEDDEEEETVTIYLLDYFDAADARAYVFGEPAQVEEGEETEESGSEVVFEGYSFVYYREDGIGCSMYASTMVFPTQKRAVEFAKQLFQ